MFYAKSKFKKLNLKNHALPSRLQARPSAKFKTNLFTFKNSQPFTSGKDVVMNKYLLTKYLQHHGYPFPEFFALETIISNLKYIIFPHGQLLFEQSYSDTLFISHKDGLPYAAALLGAYFAPDLIGTCHETGISSYISFSIKGREYDKLSPEALDDFLAAGRLTLVRHPIEDPRLLYIGFNEKTLMLDMLACQAPITNVKIKLR